MSNGEPAPKRAAPSDEAALPRPVEAPKADFTELVVWSVGELLPVEVPEIDCELGI